MGDRSITYPLWEEAGLLLHHFLLESKACFLWVSHGHKSTRSGIIESPQKMAETTAACQSTGLEAG